MMLQFWQILFGNDDAKKKVKKQPVKGFSRKLAQKV